MSAPTTAPIPASTPTAPGALPLIGHGHRLARDPLPFMTSLRERGSVVRIRIGRTPAYVVTDPALTRRVLVTDAAHFTKGGKIFDALRVFIGDGLATVADGDTHLRNRRLMQPMFNKAHIAERGGAMIEQVRAIVGAWPQGGTRDVFADMNDIALAAFLVALFGADLSAHPEGEFTALMPDIMKATIRQIILPPWILRLPLPANRAHAERVARLRALIDQAIDHHAGVSAPESTADAAEAAGCPHATELREEQGMIVSQVAAYPGHLHIDLLPAWQGRGHGRALMRAFLQALQDRGVPAVHLSMVTANSPARAFYDRLGFHEIEVPDPGPVTYLGRTTKELDRL